MASSQGNCLKHSLTRLHRISKTRCDRGTFLPFLESTPLIHIKPLYILKKGFPTLTFKTCVIRSMNWKSLAHTTVSCWVNYMVLGNPFSATHCSPPQEDFLIYRVDGAEKIYEVGWAVKTYAVFPFPNFTKQICTRLYLNCPMILESACSHFVYQIFTTDTWQEHKLNWGC